jgi:uncharacterized protein (DUF305 family)
MIHHHAQALEMTQLVPARSEREEVRRLAERIEVSQQDEIAQMQRWLRDRGERVPAPGAHAGHGTAGGHEHHDHMDMPGMLTPAQLAQLAASRGGEFDRMFLELMIHHHEGALTMVADLFAHRGAGQNPELFLLAAEVDSDQRLEIARMRRLLDTLHSDADRS